MILISQVDVSQHQRYQDLDAPCDEAAQETVTMETAAIETSVKHKKHKRGSRGRKSSEVHELREADTEIIAHQGCILAKRFV